MSKVKGHSSKLKAALTFPYRYVRYGVRTKRKHHVREKNIGSPTFDVKTEAEAIAKEGSS